MNHCRLGPTIRMKLVAGTWKEKVVVVFGSSTTELQFSFLNSDVLSCVAFGGESRSNEFVSCSELTLNFFYTVIGRWHRGVDHFDKELSLGLLF